MIDFKTLPYMKTTVKKVVLPPGEAKKGEIAFLFSSSLDQSIGMMTQKENCYPNDKYYYYYMPMRLIGALSNGKRYRVNQMDRYSEISQRILKETNLHMYPDRLRIHPENDFNLFYDLSPYLSVYQTMCLKYPIFKSAKLLLDLLLPVLLDDYGTAKIKGKEGPKERFIVLDAEAYRYEASGPLKERAKNPLFLIYLMLHKKPEMLQGLDIDIVSYFGNRVLRINPAKLEQKQSPKLLTEIKRLYRNQEAEPEIEQELNVEEREVAGDAEPPVTPKNSVAPKVAEPIVGKMEVQKEQPTSPDVKKEDKIKEAMVEHSNRAVVDVVENLSNADKEVKTAVKKTYDEAKKDTAKEIKEGTVSKDDAENAVLDKVSEEIENNHELLSKIYNEMRKNTPSTRSMRSTARDELLREKQKDLVVKGLTISDLAKINPKKTEIKKNNIKKAVTSSNPNLGEIQFQNFNSTYVEQVMPKDIVDVFTNLNNASIKMFIRDIKVEDSSDALNLKETWTVQLEDENRTRHTIKVDIPKFYDKNFLWLSGNKKSIKKQEFFLPVVKLNENTVMIVTNYNKLTITRAETRSLRETTLLDKYVVKHPATLKYFKTGSARLDNKEFLTGIEYDQYAEKYLTFKNKKLKLYFSQKECSYLAKAKNIDLSKHKGEIFIGFEGDEPLFLDMSTQRDKKGRGITDLILENLPKEVTEEIRSYPVPKRLMQTKITTMKQEQPIMVLMCLWEGLSKVLNKAGINYRLENNRKNVKPSEDFVPFKNCYLVYDATVEAELLMNGLKVLDTKAYDISEFDTQAPYLPFIEKKFGKLSILNALSNVYEFTIGSIEREILISQGLPTDLVQLMVYANSLLCDKQFVGELEQSQYRIRCAEVIPAILYDAIAKAYVPFKNSNGKNKLSIPQDIVIKNLLALNTTEDTSTLNPFLELETTHGVSTKGWRGVNLDDSYTVPKRSYDKSMTGVIAVSSSPDGQVGVNRTLTFEPSVESTRGYIIPKHNKLDQLKDVNLFSPAEMMIPLGATRDDPIRTGHSVKQSRATIPVENASPVLISNGSEELCKYYLSSDFIINADDDGKVIEYDETAKIMIVAYKNGTHRAINLDKNLVKNGGGGFELSNVLVTNLKVGDTFKKNQTLAWHSKFFSNIPTQGVRMNVGAMIKIAIYDSYNAYEDADFITEKVSDMCATEMCFRVKVAVGKNSNIYNMVKVGDEIAVNDKLIEFDESFAESEINKLLDAMGENEELKEVVSSNSRNAKKSKYSGTIEEIKIFSASDTADLSPSLQKIVRKYYREINAKHQLLEKYDKTPGILKCGMLLTESGKRTEPDRYGNIHGVKVDDGVLFEFVIKHSEPLEVGSKVANFSPLKNIVSEVIPAGYEPWSELRPGESVDSIISPSSILNRMVSSVVPTVAGNKCIVELKRSLQVIWENGKPFAERRKAMLSLIDRFFKAMDKTGANAKKYREMFTPMSQAQFTSFFKEFFSNEIHYLILDIVDYERELNISDIEDAAKVLGIPLFEYVTFPHFNMDKEHPVVTKHKILVGYLHLKRPQQTVMKKNGMSIQIDQRSAFTGQVTGGDKNGRESDQFRGRTLKTSLIAGTNLKRFITN